MKKIIRDIFSRPIFQPFFEMVLKFTLKVLNIGEGQAVETSGEKNVVEILNKISKNKEVVVFDVGAHTGEWLNMFNKFNTQKATVYSFEPEKKAFIELSKMKIENFHPVNIALGDAVEKKYLSAAQIVNTKNDNIPSEEVNVTTLDTYCKENNIKNIDLLKLDIEGYELRLLRGAKDMIKSGNIKMIQFEFGAPSEEKYSMKEFFDILSAQYTIYRVLKHGCYPISEYKHYYEILTVTNLVAIKKDAF